MRTGSSIYLRADGRWEARYQKSRDENGRIVYGFCYGSTQEEAERKRADALIQLGLASSTSILPSLNPNIRTMPELDRQKKVKNTEKFEEPLSDDEVAILDRCLWETDEVCAVGFYLSLHMGLSLAEILALRYADIDLAAGVIRISSGARIYRGEKSIIPVIAREVIIPPGVRAFLDAHGVNAKSAYHYVLSNDEIGITSNPTIGSALRRIVRGQIDFKGATANVLRCTFIRMCLEANINIESVALITGMDKALLYRYYGRFIKADPTAILRIDHAPVVETTSVITAPAAPRQLNLLILGAGSHGQTVRETAERLGIFREIAFLDDEISGDHILGRCVDSATLTERFSCAFVAIGDNALRRVLAERLRREGYILPRIIHPNAIVSQNANIGDGTIVLAQATVDAASVGEMCIVASNALVSRGATVADGAHIDCGGIVLKDAIVPEMAVIASGEIYRGETYE